MTVDGNAPAPVRSTLLDGLSPDNRIAHGFFNRAGGVSKGLYRGLNVGLGSKDDRAHIIENRTRVSRWFGLDLDRLVTVHQVHSPRVHVATADNRADRPEADALVTGTPGLVIGVLTADCGPVLFADAQAGVIGAAHAGWRGAFDGVLESTIEAMQALGAKTGRITAVFWARRSARRITRSARNSLTVSSPAMWHTTPISRPRRDRDTPCSTSGSTPSTACSRPG
jgi:copper oxidase (laccase) domain-containing protein